MEQASGPEQPAGLSGSAARGVGVLVARTLGLQLLTAGVTVVLARLLTPSDYGYFAVALAAQQVGLALAELGLPAALIREEQDPTPHQQRAVRAMTLAGGTALAALAAVIAFGILPAAGSRSKMAEITAVALVAIPVYGMRTVPMALLE